MPSTKINQRTRQQHLNPRAFSWQSHWRLRLRSYLCLQSILIAGTKGTHTVHPTAIQRWPSQQRGQDCARKMLAALPTRLCACCGISCLLPHDLDRGNLLRSNASVAAVLSLCSFMALCYVGGAHWLLGGLHTLPDRAAHIRIWLRGFSAAIILLLPCMTWTNP